MPPSRGRTAGSGRPVQHTLPVAGPGLHAPKVLPHGPVPVGTEGLAPTDAGAYNCAMQRTIRVIVAALALLLIAGGTAFATRSTTGEEHRAPAASHAPQSPEADDPSESPEAKDADPADGGAQLTDDHAAALVDLLAAQGIDATADELKTLAETYGVGGAVRLEAWAKATGKTVDELAAMFDGGMGWGAIAKQLEAEDASLDLSPGIGWIMGHGHGNANPNANAQRGLGHAKHSS